MTTIECPWCDGPVELDSALTEVACDDCLVRVEIAPDPARVLVAAA